MHNHTTDIINIIGGFLIIGATALLLYMFTGYWLHHKSNPKNPKKTKTAAQQKKQDLIIKSIAFDYTEWSEYLKKEKSIEQYGENINGVEESFLWFHYWLGRYDFLSHKPLNYDKVFIIISSEFMADNSKFIEIYQVNKNKIIKTCEKIYTIGYQNAFKESVEKICKHPNEALRNKPKNYSDPVFSAHEIIEMKIQTP